MEIDLFMEKIIQGGARGRRETIKTFKSYFLSLFFFLKDSVLRNHSGDLRFSMCFPTYTTILAVQLQRILTYTRI